MIDPLAIFLSFVPLLSGAHNTPPPGKCFTLPGASSVDEASRLLVKKDTIPFLSSFKKDSLSLAYEPGVPFLKIVHSDTQACGNLLPLLFGHPNDTGAACTAFSATCAPKTKPFFIRLVLCIHTYLSHQLTQVTHQELSQGEQALGA